MRSIMLHALALSLFLAAALIADDDKMKAESFTGLEFRGIGPALMSGRIADIVIDPLDGSTWYVAVGSGNIWKTVNAGTTWEPIFDDQGSYSIGCIALDPSDRLVVWVGAGENVSGRHVGYGDGVYKSLDGGGSWKNMGLKQSEHIAKILVDPRDSNVVYVACEGPLWAPGGERGLFKTTDGGETWKRVLETGENAGVTDIEFDPTNPDVIYAASYQRRRHVAAFLAGGPESGIHKSRDAGATWVRLEKGLPKCDVGKIGLAVSPQKPEVVYATVETARDLPGEKGEGGFFRSGDGGSHWVKMSDYFPIKAGTGPHYYQEIYADPFTFDRVYQMDVRLMATEDGGKTWSRIGEQWKHGDNHAMAFDMGDPDYLLVGSDGGVYESWDRGKNWKYAANLPVTQFYKIDLDNDLPFYNIVGGTQDNNTQLGPSRTLNVQGIRNSDWIVTVGGDGYDCAFDPQNPDIVYCEWQTGGLVRFDKRSGEMIDIKPQPEPGEDPPRWNWDAPVIVSPHSHTRLYFGSQFLYRSDDRGDSWAKISPDLSRGLNRFRLEYMGRTWGADAIFDNDAMSYYGNLTTIAESPLVEGLIYAGTDDGLVQVTEDGGGTWRKLESFPGVPELSFVNQVRASLHDADTVFAVLDNHKRGDCKPYILKSTDRGRSWTAISGDLPERHVVWCLAQDHVKPELLFAGTEFGIFFTVDGGAHWIQLKGGLPVISFRDLAIQQRESDLVGASFGRGFYILDDYSPLRSVDAEVLKREAVLFPVKNPLLYIPMGPLGGREKGSQGAAFFTAPNPPFGAVFTYYLREPLKTGKQVRQEADRKLRDEGKNVVYPDWDELKLEDREEEPLLLLIVRDDQGSAVRRIRAPAEAGFHRVTWDLRYPSTAPARLEEPAESWRPAPSGPLVVPGRFSASLVKMVEGQATDLGGPQEFEVVPLNLATLPAEDRAELLAFQKKTAELQRAVLAAGDEAGRISTRLALIKKALLDTPDADEALSAKARELELQLTDIREALAGDTTIIGRSEPRPPSVIDRIETIVIGHWNTTSAPTRTHRRCYEIACAEFQEIRGRMKALLESLDRLEKAIEEAGAPYTPGRDIPEP